MSTEQLSIRDFGLTASLLVKKLGGTVTITLDEIRSADPRSEVRITRNPENGSLFLQHFDQAEALSHGEAEALLRKYGLLEPYEHLLHSNPLIALVRGLVSDHD